jgi:hypothetical protein
MTNAICFKCGAEKTGALTQCGSCNVTPRDEHDLALSLVLSEHLSSKTQLQVLAHEIQSHLKLTVPESLLNQAREALNDPQLLAMLGVDSKKNANGGSEVRTAPTATRSGPRSTTNSSPRQRKRRLYQSELQRNPFAFLGVTTRDDRRRIVELAEEKSLELDHDACQKARSDLTSPRTRLSVEMSWFPGVSPRKAEQYLSTLHADPMSIREESGVPTLAHLNLLAAVFEAVDGNDSAEDVADFIQEMAYLVDDLSAEQVLRDINEDRAVSGFPEVKGVDQIEAELSERKRYYRNAIKNALNRLPPASLVEAMTAAVDQITYGGEEHAPELIDDLVDSYAVETQGFLQKEAESVEKLIRAVRNSAKSGEKAVKPIVDKLVVVARNWDNVAQPIQLSAKARGIDHDPSNEIAYSIRSLAIDLFNEHDMLAQSQRLTELLQELFAELPEVVERVDEDAEALADIFHNRAQGEAQKREWERDITFRAEVGLMFKDVLSISPEGVAWKNQRFPLDAVTRVRWGAVRHSVNGIPTGTTYTLAFGDNRSEAIVELKKESTYSGFLEKLWKAVGIRMLTELFETLQAGNDIRFGESTLSDDGITLIKHKFLGTNEKVHCTWGQVHVWSADGSFYIGAKDDKKTYVGLSYILTANTHILEAAIRMAFKTPGMRRLSDMLR